MIPYIRRSTDNRQSSSATPSDEPRIPNRLENVGEMKHALYLFAGSLMAVSEAQLACSRMTE